MISTTSSYWIVAAPAKVNLFLELLGKRPDGYHNLETLIVPVNLYDTLEFQSTTDGPIEVTCDQPGVPSGPANLVWKAANLMRQRFGGSQGVHIHITKRIPHEAGLGGGSSDATCTIKTLNSLWKYHRPASELAAVAANIGSDVAAFLEPGATWCTGRGEIVTPLPMAKPLHLVIIKPSVGLSTAKVYQNVQLTTPVDGIAIRNALADGNVVEVGRLLHNRLESAAFGLQTSVKAVYDGLIGCDPLGVLLSGSGSCVFAVCRDASDARRVACQWEQNNSTAIPGCRVYVVQTV
jgi:4-diphosphocytidyl-2-C-methyl-D-erythritol kinase